MESIFLLIVGWTFEYENVIQAFVNREDAERVLHEQDVSELPDCEYFRVEEVPVYPNSGQARTIAECRGEKRG